MTDPDAITLAYERARGVCECIGGGCPALTHRPGVNRCFGVLRNRDTTFFFTVARFADRTNPENIEAICTACAESPRKNSERIVVAPTPSGIPTDTGDDSPR